MRWIVIDGIDGSGKSTYARWVREHYEATGESVLVRIHPSERFLGSMTKRALQGKGKMLQLMSTLFFIGDVLTSVRQLRKDAKRYDTVIYVRYLMATAYLPERYMNLGYGFFSRMLPIPKRLLLIDIDPIVALRRIDKRNEAKEMFENLESLHRTRAKVLKLAGNGWMVIGNDDDAVSVPPRLIKALEDWDSEST